MAGHQGGPVNTDKFQFEVPVHESSSLGLLAAQNWDLQLQSFGGPTVGVQIDVVGWTY